MLDVEQFRSLVVAPTLDHLAQTQAGMASDSAVELLVGTALQESGLHYLRQLNDGPARGIYQVEPTTLHDVYDRYLGGRAALKGAVDSFLAPGPGIDDQVVWNLAFATAIARLRYWMDPEPLPAADDVEALGTTWKRVYNTAGGAGTAEEWAETYRKHVARRS